MISMWRTVLFGYRYTLIIFQNELHAFAYETFTKNSNLLRPCLQRRAGNPEVKLQDQAINP
jgi:hypothetical protein